MKLKFKLLAILVAFVCLTSFAGRDEFTKEHHFAFAKDDIESLKVINKYGKVTVSDQGGDSITVDVTVIVEHASESKAEYLLEQIEIDVDQSGSKITAETEINSNFKSKQHFEINYNINIPADRNLDITNKYGDVMLDELNANGRFVIAYGNISTGNLMTPENETIILELSYSKADFQDVNHLDADIKYSKLYMGENKSLVLESRYSTINVDKIGKLKLDSKYDGVSVNVVGSMYAESKYTSYNIDNLLSEFVLENGYGSVRVGKVDPDFKKIDIVSSYGGIKVGLGDANYRLDAECSYCGVSYPSDKYDGNRIKDNHNIKLNGNVGSGGGNVRIVSRYGSVKLND